MANTLAYYDTATITAVKSFYSRVPGFPVSTMHQLEMRATLDKPILLQIKYRFKKKIKSHKLKIKIVRHIIGFSMELIASKFCVKMRQLLSGKHE